MRTAPGKRIYPLTIYPYGALAGDGRPSVVGVLTIRPRPPRVRAQCTNDVVLSAGRATVDVHLRLEAEQGSPDFVDLCVSAPYVPAASGVPWGWRAERGGVEVREARRLPVREAAAALAVLGAPDALAVAAERIGRPRGECWRVTFARPLHVGAPILLHATLTAKTADKRLDVPLTAVLGATRMEGEATLRLAAAHPLQVEAFGLREASPEPTNHPRRASAWRIFRYSGPAVELTLDGPLQEADRTAEAAVDRAALTTYVGSDGVLEHHFVFRVSHWQQRDLPLQLPLGASLVTYQVDDVWTPRPLAADDSAGKLVVNLPAPTLPPQSQNPSTHRYEVIYTTKAPLGWLWTRVEAPVPSLPVQPAAFQRFWRLPPELSPLNNDRLRRLPGPGEGTTPASDAFRPKDLFRTTALAAPSSWFQGSEEAERRESLSDVLLGLRGKAEQKRLLGAVLVDTAAALRKFHQALVVDAMALNEAAVGPEAAVVVKPQAAEDAAPPWVDLGLTALYTPSGWLLTTRRQFHTWREARRSAVPSTAVEAAMVNAARWGRDSSGRYQAAPFWLAGTQKEQSALPSPQSALMQWTAWEPLVGAVNADGLVLVQRLVFEAIGWTLTALIGLLFLALAWRWRRLRLGLLLLWLALAGLGLLWLPAALQGMAWPALWAGCVCARLASLVGREDVEIKNPPESTKTRLSRRHRRRRRSRAVCPLFLGPSSRSPMRRRSRRYSSLPVRSRRPTNTLSWRRRGCSNDCTV